MQRRHNLWGCDKTVRKYTITLFAFLLMVALLIFSALRGVSAPFLTFLFILLALLPFYASFERRRPQARELVPIAVMASIAALGRVIFAPLPDVKPTSAIVIVAGLAFGPQAGFMTGATAALASNIFFGQGPFTPWQMFAWGLMGFCAGIFGRRNLLKGNFSICVFGFIWGILYGVIMDSYQVLGFVSPITAKSVLLVFAAGFYFNLIHAFSTVIFLLCIAKPWLKILNRVRIKYGLLET